MMVAQTSRALETRGTVFNIARFSLHDGPGIRTVVFLKGCPLSCAWCHNPEGMSARPEVFFRPDTCLACGRCAAVCPRLAAASVTIPATAPAATAAPATIAPFPDEACPASCQACADACRVGAREALGKSWDLPKLLDLVLADRAFYEASGGGVTLSGGEPLAQAPFATAFLEACGRAGLHRAVETSGFAPERVFLDLAEQTDLLLFDIKLMDTAAHKAWTGVDNALIVNNLRAAARAAAAKAAGKDIRIRRPLIPGVNDGEGETRALAALALELRLGVDLLPYHADAEDKYLKRRKPYRLAGMAAPQASAGPEASSVAECAKLLSGLGVQVRIGG